MNCQERRLQIAARLDNSLDEAEARGLDQHLSLCDACAQFQSGQEALDTLLTDESWQVEPPARLWVTIQNQIQPRQAVESGSGWRWSDLLAVPAWKPAWAALALMLACSLPLFTLQERLDQDVLASIRDFQIEETSENPFFSEVIGRVEGNPFETGGLK